jgi:glutamine amidotransferase
VRLLHGKVKIPQIGWNQVRPAEDGDGQRGVGRIECRSLQRFLFETAGGSPYFYFVHSYVCVPDDPSVVAGVTDYGETFCSAVECGSIWGTQFHPERSGRTGLRLLRTFVESCTDTL